MKDPWTERLSEYLDDELGGRERAELEGHLVECTACAETLEQLRAVARRAEKLEDRPPDGNLWPGITARLEAGGERTPETARAAGRRRISFTVPQLLAAGVALMLVTAGTVWVGLSPRGAPGIPNGDPGLGFGTPVAAAVADYDAAVAELQGILQERREELDSTTVRVLEENLAAIDRAIVEAQAALAEDPANSYLSTHLAAAMWQKMRLLRRAAAIASAAG
jgi:hypothetical protein